MSSNGSLMAGQSVGMVTKEEPLADILATLMAEAAAALEARAALRARRAADPPFDDAACVGSVAGRAAARQQAASWLKLAKAGNGASTLTKAQAIDGALIHGWIDGQLEPV